MDALYDARRGVYQTKPILRGWLHLLWFEASAVLGTLLVARAQGAADPSCRHLRSQRERINRVSALYHRGTWTTAWSGRLQRLDHAMIFFLITGTATPAVLLANGGAFGLVCLIVIRLALTAAAVHLAWMSAPEVVVDATFVRLGWGSRLRLCRRDVPECRESAVRHCCPAAMMGFRA